MDDFEKELRDALRRVDELPVPVAPPDPEAVPSATGIPRGGWTRRTALWLAAAAAAVIAVGGGVWVSAALTSSVIPAVPAHTSTPTATAELLVGRTWEATSIRGEPVAVPAGRTIAPHLVFQQDSTLQAYDGCNGINGTYRLDGAGLVLTSTFTTLAQCEDVPLQAEFARIFTDTTSAGVDGNALTLFDSAGDVVALFSAGTPKDGAQVEVDLYSGRSNIVVPLDAGTTRELYLMLSDLEAAGSLTPTEAPDLGLGFRGLVVTPTDATLPQLRILPTKVYVDDHGNYRAVKDPSGNFYVRVYDAIRPALSKDVRDPIPAPSPTIPDTTATIPPAVGAAATWTLAEPATSGSTQVVLRVTRLTCAGGRTRPLLDPVVSLGTDDIIIRVDAVPVGMATCPSNDSVTVSVTLPEPIGSRSLMDAACLEGRAVRTQECSGGAVRWTP
jgi:heat shock protein HslJ